MSPSRKHCIKSLKRGATNCQAPMLRCSSWLHTNSEGGSRCENGWRLRRLTLSLPLSDGVLTLGPLEGRHGLLQLLGGEGAELLEADEGHVGQAAAALLRVPRQRVVVLPRHEDHALNLRMNDSGIGMNVLSFYIYSK